MAEVTRGAKGMQFDVGVFPSLKEYHFQLERFTKGIEDWSPVLRRFGDRFKRQMVEQFETEGAISGERWEKLSVAYELWKQQHAPGRKIGVLTGALRSSMTGGGGYSEHVGRTTGDWGMSESSLAAPYGRFFSARRPVIRLAERWGKQYQEEAKAWLWEEAHHAGLIGQHSRVASTPLPDLSYNEPLPVT